VTENDGLRRYLKAGMTFTEVTRARIDELLRDLIKTGEIERHKTQDWVEDLVKRSRDRSGAFISTLRAGVGKPFKGLGFANVDKIAEKRGDTTSPSSAAPRKATGRVDNNAAAEKTPARKAAAKKPAKTAGA